MMQGDPRLIFGPGGSRLQFRGGQPLMDKGLENLVLISLFTSPGWCGNLLLKTPIGSDFEQECNKPITLQSLTRIRNAAERALALKILDRVTVTVTNPRGNNLTILIRCKGESVLLTRDGGKWFSQATDPAYRKVI